MNHEICVNCNQGTLLAATTDQLNYLTQESNDALQTHAEQYITQLQAQADAASAKYPLAARHLQELTSNSQNSIRRTATPKNFERVVCPRANTAESGPKGWLQRCGACRIEV